MTLLDRTSNMFFRHGCLLGGAVGAMLCAQAAGSAAAAADMFATSMPGISAVAGPPAGFDAIHASDAALAAYALPPRPNASKQPNEYGRWKRAMSLVTKRLVADVIVTNRYHGPTVATGRHTDASKQNTTYNSSSWSGYAALNSLTAYNQSSSFYYITQDYVIPVVKNQTCDGKWDLSAEWVGIDGFNGADVLQAGTEADAYCNGSTTSTSYYAWFEWFPNAETRISLPVSPGDDMYVVVWDTSATTGYAYVENQNTGVAQEYYLTAPSGTKLIGNTAEWILEATSSGGVVQTLANYSNDWFWGGTVFNIYYQGTVPGSASSVQVNMVQNGKTVSIPYLQNTQTTEYVYY